MHLTNTQSLAITARMAELVGAETFDRLFAGVEFRETDGDILFAYAQGDERADEMEEDFGLYISIVATDILQRDIEVVMVLPRVPMGHLDLQ
jgi:hypothetical protein